MIASVNHVALGIHKQQRFIRLTPQLSDKILCSHNWNLVFLRSSAIEVPLTLMEANGMSDTAGNAARVAVECMQKHRERV